MQIQYHQAERVRVAASAIQFLLERLRKKPAVVESRQRISDGIQFEFFEVLVLHDNRNAQEAGGSEHIQEGRFQNNLAARLVGQVATTHEHLVPDLDTLRLRQLHVTDCAEEALEELATCGQVEALERIRKHLEVSVLDWQTRGHGATGAGHIRNKPDLCLSPRGLGQASGLFYSLVEQPRDHSYWSFLCPSGTAEDATIAECITK